MKTRNYLVMALLCVAARLHASEPAELTTLRGQRDEAAARIEQEARAQSERQVRSFGILAPR